MKLFKNNTRNIIQGLSLTIGFAVYMTGVTRGNTILLITSFVFFAIGILLVRPRNNFRSALQLMAMSLLIAAAIFQDHRLTSTALIVVLMGFLLGEERSRLSVLMAIVVGVLFVVGIVLNNPDVIFGATLLGIASLVPTSIRLLQKELRS